MTPVKPTITVEELHRDILSTLTPLQRRAHEYVVRKAEDSSNDINVDETDSVIIAIIDALPPEYGAIVADIAARMIGFCEQKARGAQQ